MIIVTTNSYMPVNFKPKKTRRLFQGGELLKEAYRYEFLNSEMLIFLGFLLDCLKSNSLIAVKMEKSHV